MPPEVTVLMPVYNGEEYLRESIDSILNQSFTDFEFLIVNDGSTDASREIILSYDDPRITLVDNEENLGLSKSLNRGIPRARGEYIARQDADDVSHPMRLEKECAFFQKGDHDILYCRYQYMDRRGKRLSWISPMFSTQDLEKGLIGLKDPIAHGSVLMKKEAVIEGGGYNELLLFSQDYELWLRLLSMKKKIECVDYVGYYLRLLPRANKIKRHAQRRYTSIVTDYYVNDKELPTSELADLHDTLVSSKRLQQRQRASLVQRFFYWFNIQKIQLKALLDSHSINSHQPG